jgi:hypothetical protein
MLFESCNCKKNITYELVARKFYKKNTNYVKKFKPKFENKAIIDIFSKSTTVTK